MREEEDEFRSAAKIRHRRADYIISARYESKQKITSMNGRAVILYTFPVVRGCVKKKRFFQLSIMGVIIVTVLVHPCASQNN